MGVRQWTAGGLLCGLLAVGPAMELRAEPPAKAEPAPAAAAAADPLKEWAGLVAKREEIIKQAKDLQAQMKGADKAQQAALGEKINGLIMKYQTELHPQFVALAPQVAEKDPKNAEAGELALAVAFGSNDYPKLIKMTESMLKQQPPNPLAVNLAALAYYARMDFPKAKELFDQASKLDPQMFRGLSEPFAKAVPDYIQYWKDEQAIREKEAKANDLPRVLITTSKGDIELELFENEAPNTVANFINLIEKGFYDGIKFHRVEPNFVIQGGDPNSKDADPRNDGLGGPGYRIACESYQPNARKHFQGSLSMAKKAQKDTGGSQFFITHLPTPHLNSTEGGHHHTVFGRVTKGLDVVMSIKKGDTIKVAKVERKRDHKYEPKTLPEDQPLDPLKGLGE